MKRVLAALLLALGPGLWPGTAAAVHDTVGEIRCLECHRTIPLAAAELMLHDDLAAVCGRCHSGAHGDGGFRHPLAARPSRAVPQDMPLDAGGRMTCATCHLYHPAAALPGDGGGLLLRRPPGRTFCYSCHQQL